MYFARFDERRGWTIVSPAGHLCLCVSELVARETAAALNEYRMRNG